MDEDSILSIPYNSPQAFKPIYRNQSSELNLPQEIVHVIPQFDPESGLYVIFWDQVLKCFEDAIICTKCGRHQNFLRDVDKEIYHPLRLNIAIGVILEVIVENPLSRLKESPVSLEDNQVSSDKTSHNPFLYFGPDKNISYDELLSSLDSTRGIGLTLMKAINGNPQSQSDIGSIYITFLLDYTKAMEWFLKAASQDNTYAQHSIGAIYFKGLGYPKDQVLANEWYLKSAKKNYPQSLTAIGILQFQSAVYKKDPETARDFFTRADKLGCYNAPRNLASVVISERRGLGSLPPASNIDIMNLLLRAAKRGNLLAQNDLGQMYAYGLRRTPKSISKAERWHLLAAHQGNEDSQLALGRMYSKQKNPALLKWYKVAAKQGSSLGQYLLSLSLIDGIATPIDYAEAARWLQLSVRAKSSQALYLLFSIYHNDDDHSRLVKDLYIRIPKQLREGKQYKNLVRKEKKSLRY